MGQGNPVPRVSGGVPWWLWLAALLATVAVILGLVAGPKKETAADIFDRGLISANRRDIPGLQQCVETLKLHQGTEDTVAVLNGLEAVLTNRYPRGVQIFEPFLDHPNERYRELALSSSAHSYEQMGDSVRARQLHLQAIEHNTSALGPLLKLLQLYVNSGAFKSAQEILDKVISLDPQNREATESKALIQFATGDLTAARETYASLLETEGDRAVASPQLIKNYLTILIRIGEPEVALEFARQNEAIAGGDKYLKYDLLVETNQLDAEVDELMLRMKIEADSPRIAEVMGSRALNDGDWEPAVALLSQAALKMPRSTRIFERLELAATKNNQPELAEACRKNLNAIHQLEEQLLETVLTIADDMEDPELRLTAADIAVELGRLSEAERWVDAAMMVAPDRQSEIREHKNTIQFPNRPLVPIGAAFGAAAERETEPKQDSDN